MPTASKTTTSQWRAGARPRTLPAAIVPVAVGAAVADFTGTPLGPGAFWLCAVLALIVSLSLQVGVNYANDYSDGIRGTDESRVGPVRLVGQRLAEPAAVKRAALLAFLIAALAGLVLVILTQAWWLLIVGALAILAAWFYTGGSKPYGYAGLGEVVVFIFFGLVAVVGTTFVLTESFEPLALLLAVPVGLFACALLIINNLRDIPGDTEVTKRTLAVRLGDPKTRQLYGWSIAAPFLIVGIVGIGGIVFPSALPIGVLLAIVPAPMTIVPWRKVKRGEMGAALVPVLVATGQLQLAFGLLLTVGVAISR